MKFTLLENSDVIKDLYIYIKHNGLYKNLSANRKFL